MPRVIRVQRARKRRHEHGIDIGDSYFYWRLSGEEVSYSKEYPNRSQLTKSEKLKRIYILNEKLEKEKDTILHIVSNCFEMHYKEYLKYISTSFDYTYSSKQIDNIKIKYRKCLTTFITRYTKVYSKTIVGINDLIKEYKESFESISESFGDTCAPALLCDSRIDNLEKWKGDLEEYFTFIIKITDKYDKELITELLIHNQFLFSLHKIKLPTVVIGSK